MRNFLAFLCVFIIAVAGVGYFRGWYDLSSQSTDAEADFHLKVNKGKVGEDAKKAVDTAKDLGGKAVEKAGELGDKLKAEKN